MTDEELKECPFCETEEEASSDPPFPSHFQTRYRSDLLDDPRKIYKYLIKKVYKQDAACKAASIILYNAVHRIRGGSRSLFCGPAGCGKTYIWQIIRDEIYENIIIEDASNITQEGWSGGHKISSILRRIIYEDEPYIVVFDEFDKLVRPKITRSNENVSEVIQAELLALVQPSDPLIRVKHGPDTPATLVDLNLLSWVFCGSFALASEKESAKKSSSGMGFNAVRRETKAFDEELTVQTLIDFGLIPELASRLTRIVNLRPLTLDNYRYLLLHHDNSPIRFLERAYGLEPEFILNNVLTAADIESTIKYAYNNSLGVRSCTAKVQTVLDDYLFDHYDEITTTHSY